MCIDGDVSAPATWRKIYRTETLFMYAGSVDVNCVPVVCPNVVFFFSPHILAAELSHMTVQGVVWDLISRFE